MKLPNLDDLADLEARIQRALSDDDARALDILGYGEISTVVELASADRRFACKRLPPFPQRERFEAYRVVFESYVARLAQRGTQIVETSMVGLDTDHGVAVFCVQPLLEADQLLPAQLASSDDETALVMFELVLDCVEATVDEQLGLDGQLSNWAWVDGELRYLDLTTPMLRDPQGAELLDLELHLASLPWVVRGVVRRFVAKAILDQYYLARAVVLDALGNLHKERLTHLMSSFVEAANRRLGPPFDAAEVARYYRNDARLWEMLLQARRLD